MKKKQFESICRTILPDLSGFACKGWLLYAHPVSHILQGFCCDDSGFDPTRFAVWAFVLPLYIPTQHLYFNFGHRLRDESGCEKWWNIQEPNLAGNLLDSIQREGPPFLDQVQRPSQMVTLVERLTGNTNPHSLEAIAYSLAMADEYSASQEALERLMKTLDRNIPWHSEMFDRAAELAQQLLGDPQRAKQQLFEWEQTTVKNLGI